MSYLNAYIDPEPTWGWQGGPEFSTTIVQLKNGRENRNAEWANARHKFEMSFQNIDTNTYRLIKQMHGVCRGRLHVFRFRDELDYSASDERFATGDGATKTFQLCKISTIDGVTYQRNVYAPLVGVVVKSAGTVTAVTLDTQRGLVTFATAPSSGAALTWSGPFDIWVRFDNDYLPFSLDSIDTTNGSVSLLEEPPPPI